MKDKEFIAILKKRRKAGESLSSIGASFGVSRQAVWQWLRGVCGPSNTALYLAELRKNGKP